ncbi:hypothetical protein GCM10029992_13450 [Glycomyces albus]
MSAQTYTVTSTADVSAKSRRRWANVSVWTLQIVLALFFVVAGAPKILGDAASIAAFEQIGAGQWFRVVTGLVEVAGAIGLLIPRLSSLAAGGLAITMVFATVANQGPMEMPPSAGVMTLALAAVFACVAWYRRDQNRRLLDLVRR